MALLRKRQYTLRAPRSTLYIEHAESLPVTLAKLKMEQPVFVVRNPDVRVKIGEHIFGCHMETLHGSSGYFKELFDSGEGNENDVIDISILGISPSIFEQVQRYMYCRAFEMDKRSICDVLNAADALSMPDLRRDCVSYMLSSVGPDNCLKYWRSLEPTDWLNEPERKLIDKCRSLARAAFRFSSAIQRPLADASDSIVETLLCEEDLQVCTGDVLVQVTNEQQVCDILLRWLESRNVDTTPPTGNDSTSTTDELPPIRTASVKSEFVDDDNFVRFLRAIRWSGVHPDYVKSVIIGHPMVRRSPAARRYMERVLRFQVNGIQFENLITRHRPATRLERSALVVVGGMEPSAVAVSLQYTDSVETRHNANPVPFVYVDEAASVVVAGRALYVVGVGEENTEIWRFDVTTGWRLWSSGGLCFGRRRHCVAAIDGVLFVVGGYCPADRSLVSCVEQLDISGMTNGCQLVEGKDAELPQPVVSAACAAYGSGVYVFGGLDGQRQVVSDVQLFDTVTCSWTTLLFRLPVHAGRLNAAVYDDTIIILGADLNMVYKPDLDNWIGGVRDYREQVSDNSNRCDVDAGQYACRANLMSERRGGTEVSDFGLAIDDGLLYVIGGRRFYESQSGGKTTTGGEVWKPTDEIRSVPLKLALSGVALKPGQWSAHAKLPHRSMISVCGLLSLQFERQLYIGAHRKLNSHVLK